MDFKVSDIKWRMFLWIRVKKNDNKRIAQIIMKLLYKAAKFRSTVSQHN